MANSSGKDKPKTMDVSHPGKSIPNATSRPTIVGHRTVLKDPMVTGAADDEHDEKHTVASMTGRKITPLTDEEKKPTAPVLEKKEPADEAPAEDKKTSIDVADSIDETAKEAAEPEKTPEPEVPAEEKSGEKESEPEKTEAPKEEAAEAETPEEITDAPATKADTQKADEKKLQEEIAKQEAIEKLVTDKTYYAPIGQKTRKRSKRQLWLLVFVIIAVAGAYAILDAQLVKNNIALPHHFFKQEQVAEAPTEVPTSQTVTLPKSGLKLTFNPRVWTFKSTKIINTTSNLFSHTDNAGNKVQVNINEEKRNTPNEPNVCLQNNSCAALYTNVEVEKIPAGGKTDLYFANYLDEHLNLIKTKVYTPGCMVSTMANASDYPAGKSIFVPTSQADYYNRIHCAVFEDKNNDFPEFSTPAEAKAWTKTSENYKLAKALLTSLKY